MKVYGSLERAQLEPLAANPTAGVTGRIWHNTVDGKTYVDDGAAARAVLKNDGKLIVGNSATAAENIKVHRGGLGLIQFLLGSDATAEGTLSSALSEVSLKFESYPDGSKPANGQAGRVIWNSTFNALNVDNGTSWVSVGSGGGVGAYLDFYPDPSNGPLQAELNGLIYWEFEDEQSQVLHAFLKVPDGYQAGQQLQLAISVESDEAGAAQLIMQATSYLVRSGTDPMTSVTNSNVATASYSPAAIAAQELVLDLTAPGGTINAIAVSSGDIIKIQLTKPTDTSTNNIRLFQSLVEVRTV